MCPILREEKTGLPIWLCEGFRRESRRQNEEYERNEKEIPEFKSEAEEFEFWSSKGEGADSTKYVDWSQERHSKFPNLKLDAERRQRRAG
jgi:hypothetical protein